jgi:hypothetical protein
MINIEALFLSLHTLLHVHYTFDVIFWPLYHYHEDDFLDAMELGRSVQEANFFFLMYSRK